MIPPRRNTSRAGRTRGEYRSEVSGPLLRVKVPRIREVKAVSTRGGGIPLGSQREFTVAQYLLQSQGTPGR